MTLDVAFTSADALRAADNVTPVFGSVIDSAGRRLAPGARIEAYIGDTLCGIGALSESVLLFQNRDAYDVLSRLDGNATLRDVLDDQGLSRVDAGRWLCRLLLRKILLVA